jgi:hypothetical protein
MHMHADPVGDEGEVSLTQEEFELLSELDVPGSRHVAHSLLSVLMPAKPPQPKNARVIRLFDYEADANDAGSAKGTPADLPGAAVAKAQPQSAAPVKPEPKNREAAKAARNQSLFAAARLG